MKRGFVFTTVLLAMLLAPLGLSDRKVDPMVWKTVYVMPQDEISIVITIKI